MAKVVTDNKYYTEIANTIRALTYEDSKTEIFPPAGLASAIESACQYNYETGEQTGYERGIGEATQHYDRGYNDGENAEYGRFWDAYQGNGARGKYEAAFSGQYWNDEIFNPKYDLVVTKANSMFSESLITGHEKIRSADFSQCTNFSLAFHASAIEEFGVIDFASCGSLSQTFQNAKVKKIAKIKVYEGNTFSSTVFSGAASLTDVTFEGILANSISLQWSPLTVESMKSIILALKDYNGTDSEYTYTLTFSDECWEALLNDGTTAPNGKDWGDYVDDLCWNY